MNSVVCSSLLKLRKPPVKHPNIEEEMLAFKKALGFSPTYPYSYSMIRRLQVRMRYLEAVDAYIERWFWLRDTYIKQYFYLYYFHCAPLWRDGILPIVDDYLGMIESYPDLQEQACSRILSQVFYLENYMASRHHELDVTIRNLGSPSYQPSLRDLSDRWKRSTTYSTQSFP